MTYVYGKRQTVGSCVSQKHENLRLSTCLTLLRSYSIHLGNRQERGLNKSSFSVFWQKENFILPFAINFMLNLSTHVTRFCVSRIRKNAELCIIKQNKKDKTSILPITSQTDADP